MLGGLPLALRWPACGRPGAAGAAAGRVLHALSGYAGGLGYAALFGLLVIRRGWPPAGWGRRRRSARCWACGQRSLSCYLAQSVAFVALLPAWTLGLGPRGPALADGTRAVGVWLVILLVAVVGARAGYRGPAETLLRRLTYGAR